MSNEVDEEADVEEKEEDGDSNLPSIHYLTNKKRKREEARTKLLVTCIDVFQDTSSSSGCNKSTTTVSICDDISEKLGNTIIILNC